MAKERYVALGRKEWACTVALALLALAIPVAQLTAGVRIIGPHFAQDGAFAVAAFDQFKHELAAGIMVPKWTFEGNFNLGSPLFFFYPPGAYYFSNLVSGLTNAPPDQSVLGLSAICFIATSIFTCALWLRRTVGWRDGLLGGALYALSPYIAFINPQMRLAFAEMAAAPLWPLLFLAIDASKRRPLTLLVTLSPVLAAFCLVHAPSFILASGLAVIYAAFADFRLKAAVLNIFIAVTAVGFAGILAGFYLIPAATLQGTIPVGFLDQGVESALLKPSSFRGLSGALNNLALIVPVLGAIALTLARHKRLTRISATGLMLAVTVVLISPLATPLWRALPPLHKVQFPWRVLSPISLLSAAVIVRQLNGNRGLHGKVYVGAALVGFMLLTASVISADRKGTPQQRTAEALGWWNSQPREYIPLPAARLGWIDWRNAGGRSDVRAAGLKSSCITLPFKRRGETLDIPIGRCEGSVRLPVLYFPGWRADVDGRPANITPARRSGLVEVAVPSGGHVLHLTRGTLPQQTLGLWLSISGIAIWLILWVLSLASRRLGGVSRTSLSAPDISARLLKRAGFFR